MIEIVQAVAADADAVTDVYLRSRDGAGDALPPGVHPPDEVREHVAGTQIGERQTWIARDVTDDGDTVTVGVLVLAEGRVSGIDPVPVTELDWLWVVPEQQGHGVGTALLDHAKALAPAGLALWTFVSNMPARQFYEHRGFAPIGGTDGSGNEEGAPDVRYLWRPDAS